MKTITSLNQIRDQATASSASTFFQGSFVSGNKLVRTAMVLIGLLAVSHAGLAQIVSGYTLYAPGEIGTYTYFDDTRNQLLDGVIGANSISASVTSGPAYEWIGWRVGNGGALFSFDGTVDATTSRRIDTISIGFNRAESAGIFLPPSVVIGNIFFPNLVFAVSPAAILDQRRGFLEFDVSAYDFDTNFSVSWVDGNTNRWVFVDEVSFTYSTETVGVPPTGSAAVPEPSTYGMIAAGLLGMGAALRRRLRRS